MEGCEGKKTVLEWVRWEIEVKTTSLNNFLKSFCCKGKRRNGTLSRATCSIRGRFLLFIFF